MKQLTIVRVPLGKAQIQKVDMPKLVKILSVQVVDLVPSLICLVESDYKQLTQVYVGMFQPGDIFAEFLPEHYVGTFVISDSLFFNTFCLPVSEQPSIMVNEEKG